MFIVSSYSLAIVFCFVTMLCWGSWGNTQKLTQKSWRYELFYWDYVIGMVLFALALGFTMGSVGDKGRPFLQDLAQVSWQSLAWVFLGGIVFNASNILLSASASLSGMSVAFPPGVLINYFGQSATDPARWLYETGLFGKPSVYLCESSKWAHSDTAATYEYDLDANGCVVQESKNYGGEMEYFEYTWEEIK